MGVDGRKLPAYPPSTLISPRGRQLGTMLEQLARVGSIRGVHWGPAGPLLLPNGTIYGFVGVATSNFAARSGSTAGVGTAQMVQCTETWNNTPALTGAQLATLTGQTFYCYYPSSNTMTSGNGINSGQYVWVQQDQFGQFVAMPLECS